MPEKYWHELLKAKNTSNSFRNFIKNSAQSGSSGWVLEGKILLLKTPKYNKKTSPECVQMNHILVVNSYPDLSSPFFRNPEYSFLHFVCLQPHTHSPRADHGWGNYGHSWLVPMCVTAVIQRLPRSVLAENVLHKLTPKFLICMSGNFSIKDFNCLFANSFILLRKREISNHIYNYKMRTPNSCCSLLLLPSIQSRQFDIFMGVSVFSFLFDWILFL